MYRSFTDRVFGGVCGGLGGSLHINPWLLRAVFLLLTPLSFGLVAVFYVLLWWVLPQESLVAPRRRSLFPILLVMLLVALTAFGWIGRLMGWLQSPSGTDLLLPGVLLVMSIVFFLRQVRG